MKGAHLVQVLADSLHQNKTQSSFRTLNGLKDSSGFAIELLIISDDKNYDYSIRQSALVFLKNMIADHCSCEGFIPSPDIETLKESLLEALIRNIANSKLTPIYREIIYLMAQKYYPKQWPNITENCMNIVQNGSDLGSFLGAVETLKAIYAVFAGAFLRGIELSNLCNKTMLPLLGLASRLFQNFNQQTSLVLVGLFKLFSSVFMDHLPEIVRLNIHSFMIFAKKILDIQADLSAPDNVNLFLLKRISLRILFRIYQKHANFNISEHKDFAQHFHSTYTKSFLETFILQIMLKDNGDKTARKRNRELTKISLSCIAYISRQNPEAALLLIANRDAIINLCFEKFRSSLSRNYTNFNDFKLYMHENRVHFREYVMAMITCDAVPDQQSNSVSAILGLLLDYLDKGDNEYKELALYLFTEISNEVRYLTEKIQDKMVMLVLNYVKPLLEGNNHIMVRARACELITSYSYIDLPEEHISDIASLIYNCMLTGNSQKQVFLKIYACNAFSSLMRYEKIAQFIKPFIPDILRIYTDLLSADASIIKNFSDLIDLLEEQIAPYANDLTKMFIQMFAGYAQQNETINKVTSREDEDKEDDDSEAEEEDTNQEVCARACISSIRQILRAGSANIHAAVRDELIELVVWVFSDTEQNYVEEGFNILNLILYKQQDHIGPEFLPFFRMVVYALLGLPKECLESLRRKGTPSSQKYADILENICADPDKDILQNSIGCIRNFIAKSSARFLRNQVDDFGISCMEYLFRIVKHIHQNQDQSKKETESDRLIVLTILVTLLEYQVVNEMELSQILMSVQKWMQMEEEFVSASAPNQGFGSFGQGLLKPKYIYTPLYLQILLLAVKFYDSAALQKIDINYVVQKVLFISDSFKCDSELSRVLVGFTHILEHQLIGDQGLLKSLLEALPELVRRLCSIRQNGDSPQNDYDMDDQAEEERVLGDDENTHLAGWAGQGPSNKDLMLQGSESDEDSDWEQEFNKYYVSPLDKVQELNYLQEVLAKNSHIYGQFLSQDKQEQLSLYLANAPPKP